MKGLCPVWLGKLQPLFNFTANKYVLIKDWRLGVLLRALQVAIVVYVLTDVFQKASYLTVEVPTGSVTVWPDGMSMEEKVVEFARQREAVKDGKLIYCKDPDRYDFHWNGVYHGDFKCSFLKSANLFIKGESQAFVTTSMRVEKLHFYSQIGTEECAEMERRRLIGSQSGACAYSEQQSYFPIRPEDITLNFIHSYRTSSVVDKKGTLPRTIIKAPDFSDEVIEVNAKEGLKLTLDRLLKIAGINLDKRLDEQDNNPCKDRSQANFTNGAIEYPHARLSGITLQMTFNYYTRKLAPEPYSKVTGEHSEAVICIVEVVPQNKWSLLGSEIRYMMNEPSDPLFLTTDDVRDDGLIVVNQSEILASQTDFQRNGVSLIFTTSGSIGRFDISSLINALVAGSVLLAVAQMITTYFAIYALGLSSELYKAFMKETVNWRQEYARYAAQAFVAGHAFMQYDSNKSMKLDRKEVFDVLKGLMIKNKDMEEWKLAALADFLMRHGERGTDVHKGKFDANQKSVESYIDIEEWIDIFTEEKANWPALQRLIEEEYPDESSRARVMNLLNKSARKQERGRLRGMQSAEISDYEGGETDGTPMSEALPGAQLMPRNDIEADLESSFLLKNRPEEQQALQKRHKKFEANEVPKLSLHQLLQFSGIDLDKRLNKQDNNPCNDTSQGNKTDGEIQYPYARLSGVTLQMTFNYYTKKLAPKPYRDLAGDDSEAIICIVEVVPHNRWSHLGTEIRHMMNKPSDPLFLTINGMGDGNYNQSEILTSQTNFQRQGVAFVFSTSGSIGRFAISSLMNALVAGSVLFAIAHWITTLIATYAMTLKSDAYKALMYQEVDWEQAYARYATHIIVAGFVFDQMDKNDNGKLEHKEIFNHLKKLLGFSDEENTNKNKNKNEIETEESIETGGEVKNINEEENKEGNNITYENKGEIKIEGKKENDNKNEIETEESIETNGEIQNVNEEENDNKNENNNVKKMNKKLDIEKWKLDVLAEFLVKQGDLDLTTNASGNNGSKKSDERSIDLVRWAEIFTGERVLLAKLHKLIEKEHKKKIKKSKASANATTTDKAEEREAKQKNSSETNESLMTEPYTNVPGMPVSGIEAGPSAHKIPVTDIEAGIDSPMLLSNQSEKQEL
eukprot:g8251.t1